MFLDPLKATLFEVLVNRRSRRVGLGMSVPSGPFQYKSPHPPIPLTEDEEAALAFAACGVTGYALADLSYGAREGGTMLAGRIGRTVASPDAVNAVAVLVTNDRGTWLLKRPQDFAPAEFLELVHLAKKGALTELYRRSRIQLSDRRTAPPLDAGHNFSINRWSLYAPGTTYFLPILETTALTINALLELFGEDMAVFLRDERAWFRPAGVGRFARSHGGHLHDAPRDLRSATIQMTESALLESMATEHGMVLQNLALMTEALGLGGFPNFARVQLVQSRRFPHAVHAGQPLCRCSAISFCSSGVVRKGSRHRLSSRIRKRQTATAETILPALLQINGGRSPSLRRHKVWTRWSLSRRRPTEHLARRGFLQHKDTDAERRNNTSHDCVLQLRPSPLRPLPRLQRPVPDRHRLPGVSRRRRFLRPLL